MKKDLITLSPICVILFVILWISQGLKCALIIFGIVLVLIGIMILIMGLVYVLGKWIEFVDKHIKD